MARAPRKAAAAKPVKDTVETALDDHVTRMMGVTANAVAEHDMPSAIDAIQRAMKAAQDLDWHRHQMKVSS